MISAPFILLDWTSWRSTLIPRGRDSRGIDSDTSSGGDGRRDGSDGIGRGSETVRWHDKRILAWSTARSADFLPVSRGGDRASRSICRSTGGGDGACLFAGGSLTLGRAWRADTIFRSTPLEGLDILTGCSLDGRGVCFRY